MAKHTPGPWEPFSDGSVIDIRQPGAPAAATITRLYPSTPLAQRWEDARLIAAAPELLEALRELTAGRWYQESQRVGAYERARAAIAKAEGSES